jgi:hypothetical protein
MRHADVRPALGKDPGVACDEQGPLTAGRAPDDRIEEAEAVLAAGQQGGLGDRTVPGACLNRPREDRRAAYQDAPVAPAMTSTQVTGMVEEAG